MLENNSNNPLIGYSNRSTSFTTPITSGYDRNLEKTPLDSYELESIYGKENPKFEEVERTGPDWFWDSWSNFCNKRDEIRLMTERAKIIHELTPEIEKLEDQMSRSDISENELIDLQSKYDSLLKDREEVFSNISEIESELKNRKETSGPSAYYKAKEQLSQDKGLTDLDYWKYSVPGTMGSSFSDMTSYGAAILARGVQYGTHALAATVAAGGTFYSGGLGVGAALGAAAGIETAGTAAALAISAYGAERSNRSESLAEVYSAYKDRVSKAFEDSGISLQQYANSLKQKDPSLSNFTDDEVADKLLTGEISTDDESVNEVLKQSKEGLGSVYARNRALIAADIVQNVLLGLKVGKIGELTKWIGKKTKVGQVVDATKAATYDKVADALTGWYTRMALSSPTKGAMTSIAKKLSKYGLAALSEGFEEGSQNVFNRDFLAGKYDNESVNMLSAYTSMLEANWRVGKILAGIDTETELANDPDFYNEVKGGIALGLLMGAGPVASSVTVGTAKELAANKLVKELTVDNLSNKDEFEKITAYTKAISGRIDPSEDILNAFRNYRDQVLPKESNTDITKEDIDNEIDLFNKVRTAVKNKDFNSIAKSAGYTKGSDEYNALIGLSILTNDRFKESIEYRNKVNSELLNVAKDLDNDINLKNGGETNVNVLTINRLNHELAVLQNVIDAIESDPKNGLSKLGITNKNNVYGYALLGTAKRKRENVNKALNTISNSEEGLNQYYQSYTENSDKFNSKYFESLLAEAAVTVSEIERNSYNGTFLDKNGNTIPFNKLDKEEKANIVNKVKELVNKYLEDRNNTDETVKRNAKDFSTNKPEEPTSSPTPTEEVKEPEMVSNVDSEIPSPKPTEETKPETKVEEKTEEPKATEKVDNGTIEEEKEEELINRIQAELEDENFEEDGGVTIEEENVEGATIEEEPTYSPILEEDINEEPTLEDEDESGAAVTEEEISFEETDAETGDRNKQLLDIDNSKDIVSSTLFYSPTSDTPLLPGYKNGIELSEFISDPNIVNILATQCKTRFFINTEYKTNYVPGDPSTYNDAPILLEIVHGNDKYLMFLKTPDSIPNATEEAKKRLIENRNSIITALENAKPGQIVSPTSFRSTTGEYNVNRENKDGVMVSVQRPLYKNKGMGIPENYHEINDDNVKVGIGKGVRGDFVIFDANDRSIKGVGRSGNVYYVTKSSQTPSGAQVPIQLNIRKLNDFPFLVDSLMELFFNHQPGSTKYLINGVTETVIEFEEIFNFIFHFGSKTVVDANSKDLDFLKEKQFFYDKQGMLHIGNKKYDPITFSDDNVKNEIKSYIKDNFHFNVDKGTLWGTMNKAIPSLAEYFRNNPSINEYKLSNLTFKREDFDNKTTVLGWMIGNDLLRTDLKDKLFTNNFIYYKTVEVIDENAPNRDEAQSIAAVNTESVSDISTVVDDESSVSTVSTNTDALEEYSKKAEEGIDPFDSIMGAPRTTSNPITEVKRPVTENEKNWLESKLGLSPEVSQDVALYIGNNQWAMGMCRLDSITLYSSAVSGTLYHEAFHRVSLLLSTPEERRKIYDLYRRKNKTDADDNSVEESLAEDFRTYMLETTDPDLNIVKRFFNKLKYFVKTWFNKSDRAIYNLFRNINSGSFKNIKVDERNVQEFIDRYKNSNLGAPFRYKGVEINNISNTQIEETVNALLSASLLLNDIKFSGNLDNLDLSKIKAALDPNINEALLNKGTLTKAQADVRTEIYEKFDTFSDLIKEELRKFKVIVSNTEEERDSDTESKESGEHDSAGLNAHTRSSLEVSSKSNALPAVKIFIACLPNQKFDENGKLVTIRNQATGLPTTVNFDIAWKVLSNTLAKCNTVQEIINECENRGSNIPLFKTFANSLNSLTKVLDSDTEESKIAKENLSTQILNTFRKNKAQLLFLLTKNVVNEDGSVSVDIAVKDESTNKEINSVIDGWTNNLVASGIIKIENNKYSLNKDIVAELDGLVKQFDENLFKHPASLSSKDSRKIKLSIVNTLNKFGINVDMQTLNTMLGTKYYDAVAFNSVRKMLEDRSNDSLYFLLHNKFTDLKKITEEGNIRTGNFTSKLDKFYQRVNIIKDLAEAYCINNPSPAETSIRTTDGKLFYSITEHNYLSDYTLELNTDKDAVKKLANVAYVMGVSENTVGSVIVKNLLDNKSLAVQTIIGFKKDNSEDTGRKYTEISPLENYVMKMALTRNNRVLLPTMGDSVRYDVLSGDAVKGFSFSRGLNISNKNGNYDISFETGILNRFIQYFTAELETIVFNYNNPPTDPVNTIKNYDTGNRNGYRLRYFDGITGLTTGDKTINEILKEAESSNDNYATAKVFAESILNTWNGLTSAKKRNIMNNYLKEVFKQELDYAKEVGILDWDGKKFLSVKNTAIPSSFLSSTTNVITDSNLVPYKEQLAVLDVMMAYFANSVSSIIEFGKIYTKDPAYYKNPVDMIKRLREVLSTGVVPRTDYESNPELNDFKEFTVATLADNEIVSRQFDEIKKSAARSYAFNLLQQSGKTEQEAIDLLDTNTAPAEIIDQANAMADNRFKGYSEVNQTDATVLLSPEGYKQLVRRINGWTKDVEKAFNVLNDTKVITDENSSLYHESLNTVIQPLKCMFFGERDIVDLKRSVPIFDKMAMFPVFPIFATGDMKAVYDRMVDEKNPIHMLAFESAVKVGQDQKTSIYNKDGSINFDGLNNIVTHKQPLNRFRRQMVTDPHDAGHEQMFVSQAQKAAMLNIRKDNTYTTPDGEKLSGSELYRGIFDTINKLTVIGKDEVDKELGVYTDADGNISIESDKLMDSLKAAAEASHMDQNTIDGLTPDSKGKTAPLSAISNSAWVESKIIGMHNSKIIDVSTPGGMFIQMSSIAYNDLTVRSDKGVRDLKFDTADGTIECCISINLLKTIIPDYDKMSFVEAKNWLLDHHVIGRDGVKAGAIGYRIPAQGPSSVAALKIVDVYPENIGDTITLPDEWTALTGSDYDIDKLYIARYNYDINGNKIGKLTDEEYAKNKAKYTERLRKKHEDWDDEKIALEVYKKYGSSNTMESKEYLQNRLLDLYIASISNPLQYSESRQPLDAVTSYLTGKILKDIDSLQGNTGSKNKLQLYNATPGFQNKTKADLIAGKTNLGAVALSNSHHSLAQAVGLNNDRVAKNVIPLGINNLHGIYSANPNYHDKQRIVTLISDWISALVNAHVDVAKDPYINRLNVRKFTMNVTNFLLRAGKGEATFYFLSQKILRDVADAFEAYSGYYGIENVSSPSTAAKKKVENLYISKLQDKGLDIATINSDVEMTKTFKLGGILDDIDKLRDIMPQNDTPEWYITQLAILRIYEDIEPYARALSELTKLSQIDTKKFGNNYALQQNFLMKMDDFAFNNKTYDDPLSIIKNTFLKDKLLYGLIRPRKYISKVLLRTTPEFENKRRYIYKLTGRKQAASDSYVNNITRAMEACYKSKFWYDYAIKNNIDINALFKGNMSIPKRLYRIKRYIANHPELGLLNSDGSFNNALLDSIDTLLKTDKQANLLPDFLQFKYNKSDDHNLDDHIIRAWEELLEFTVTNPELQETSAAVRNFARDLAVYAFLSSGDAFGKNNIFKYVPNSFRESSGYYDYIRHLESNPEELNDLIKASEVIRSLWWNDDIVPAVDITTRSFDETGIEVRSIDPNLVHSYSDKVIIKNNNAVQEIPSVLTLNGSIANKYNLVVGESKDDQTIYKPFIKVNYSNSNNPLTTELYRYAGYRVVQNRGRQYISPVYVLTSKRGMNYKGMVLSEFNTNKSILPANNNKSYNLPSSFVKNTSFILKDEANYVGEIENLENILLGPSTSNTNVVDNKNVDINNTDNTNNDPVNFNNVKASKVIIERPKTILTNEELNKLKPFVGSKPRIACASEMTDPAFHSKTILDFLNGKTIITDKLGRQLTSKDINALYIITKHDGLPIEELLKHPIPKIIHFSITTLGGTKWEKGVMKYSDMLDRVKAMLDLGLDPESVTIRIDPIVPGVTDMKDIEEVIKRSSEMGIKNIRFSVMDWYSTTSKYMTELGYDYSKYYNKGERHARPDVIKGIEDQLIALSEKYDVTLSSCAEPTNSNTKIKREGCLSVNAVNNMLGTNLSEDSEKTNQRKLCSCFGGKTDLLKYTDKCASVCAYCYAHHNSDTALQYYNEDGTLKDMPLTRLSNLDNSKKESSDIDEFTWADKSNNSYEISTKGDKRFSALNATFKPGTIIEGIDVSNMTIEDVYQKVIKKSGKGKAPAVDSILNLDRIDPDGDPSWINNPIIRKRVPNFLSLKLYLAHYTNRKSLKAPALNITKEDKEDFSYFAGYLPLWQEWARQNPELIEELREKAKGKVLTDMFANTGVSQARALADILNYTADDSESENTGNTDTDLINSNNNINTESKTANDFDQFVKESGDIFDEAVSNKVRNDINNQSNTNNTLSFTFKDGFTVSTDFELNDQQKEALNELYDFYNSEETSFSLQGYAGTGKTTIMKIFDKYLKSQYSEPIYIAPTHKANVVTMANNPEVTAKTIHSFLGLLPDYNLMEDTFDLNKLQFNNNNFNNDNVVPGSFIVIDESSMIPDTIVDHINKLAKDNSYKIVYMGDPAQLSPVNQYTTSKSLSSENKIELTKVERTGDNAILDAATRIRSNQPLPYKTDLNDKGDGIIYTNKRDTLIMFLRNLVNETNFKDPLFLRVLTGTNDNIKPFNNIIRKIMFGDNAPQLVKGDILMGYNNEQRTRDKRNPYKIMNSVDYIVDEVSSKIIKDITLTDGKIKVSGFNVTIHNAYTNAKVKCFILDSSDKNNDIAASKVTVLIKQLWKTRKEFLQAGNHEMANKILTSINTISNSFSTMNDIVDINSSLIRSKTFDYAYTQTVHKSQGATYKNTVILEDSFNKFDQSERQKLKYVAITRAKNKILYYTSNSNVNNKDITDITRSQVKEMQKNAKQLEELGKKRQNECK